jgi:hypothetical protein
VCSPIHGLPPCSLADDGHSVAEEAYSSDATLDDLELHIAAGGLHTHGPAPHSARSRAMVDSVDRGMSLGRTHPRLQSSDDSSEGHDMVDEVLGYALNGDSQ